MTDADRELVELAAKGACYELIALRGGSLGIRTADGDNYWNPLEEDEDAFRLMVDCNLGVSVPPMINGLVDVCTFNGPLISIREEDAKACRRAVARRAITRAAAEIGRGM